MRVIATRPGFYDNKRRKVGEIFTLKEIKGLKPVPNKIDVYEKAVFTIEQQFSPRWMQPVDGDAPVTKKGKAAVSTPKVKEVTELEAQTAPRAQDDTVI